MSDSKNKYIELIPDYINGNIQDKNLIKEIEKELEHNKELSEEYAKIKDIFAKIRDTEAFSPPENYFNNILPRINSKLEKQHFSKFKKFIFNWKLAISFGLIILVILLYKPIANYFEGEVTVKQIPKDSNFIAKSEYITDSTANTKINTNIEVNENKTNISVQKTFIKQINLNENGNETVIIENFNEEEINEEFQDYFDFESEFENLPKDEQQKILENFENLKI